MKCKMLLSICHFNVSQSSRIVITRLTDFGKIEDGAYKVKTPHNKKIQRTQKAAPLILTLGVYNKNLKQKGYEYANNNGFSGQVDFVEFNYE